MYRKIILALFCATCAATALLATAKEKDETPSDVVKPTTIVSNDDQPIKPAQPK